MIIRIVRMKFQKGTTDAFLSVFKNNRDKILNFPGCTYLELFADVSDPLCYTTISHWKTPEDLEQYRHSELFRKVWQEIKPSFSGQPVAFSLSPEKTHT